MKSFNVPSGTDTIKYEIVDAKAREEEKFLLDDLPGTTTTVTMDNNGDPISIVHREGGTTVRTDTFVWGNNTVTETRTIAGKYITITTNLITLAQTVSEILEVV